MTALANQRAAFHKAIIPFSLTRFMMADETKIIYHIDDEETPYLVKISKGPSDVTLGDFKNILNRPSYKFFFKSMDDDFGVVKEEIKNDNSGLPCVNGRVVAWLVTSSEGSASDVGRTFSESGSEPHDQQSVLSDPDSTGLPQTRGAGSGDSRPPSFHGRTGLKPEKQTPDSDLESISSRQSSRHRPRPHRSHKYKSPVDDSCEESSIFSSDLETTSVADSEDDRRSRISSITDGSSLYHGRHRRRRRRPRMPHVQRCTSFSTITESTMSLNIITVTLNMDKANFLGISIVGQSGSRGDGGIHVGSVMKGGAVALDGRIEPGDMLLQVNEVDFQNMSNDDAVRVLREMVHKPGPITLTVAKCWDPSPQGYFTLPQSEPVRPINTEAWVQQLAAMREFQAKEMVNQSLGTMTSTSSSLTSSLPESDRFTEDNYLQLHVNSDMSLIVKALASADSGLDVRDRMWLKITIPNAFIGSDLVDWLFTRVQGFTDRREARKYASSLLKAGYIRHTVNKITFSEQCYYVFGDLGDKMANLSIKEHDGSDQDTLAPLPQPNNWAGNAPTTFPMWRPPYQMPQHFPDQLHPYNPAAFAAPSQTGSGSPRSVSSGSQKSREKEIDRESRSSGGSSTSGSSKGDRASVVSVKDRVPGGAPVVRDYGRLDQVPDHIAASRSSFQIALANPCELFVDVM